MGAISACIPTNRSRQPASLFPPFHLFYSRAICRRFWERAKKFPSLPWQFSPSNRPSRSLCCIRMYFCEVTSDNICWTLATMQKAVKMTRLTQDFAFIFRHYFCRSWHLLLRVMNFRNWFVTRDDTPKRPQYDFVVRTWHRTQIDILRLIVVRTRWWQFHVMEQVELMFT